MTIHIPTSLFDGISKWLRSSGWIDNYDEILEAYFASYVSGFGDGGLDELEVLLGTTWYTVLEDMAFNDFLTSDFDGNTAINLYLKKQGWKEKPLIKAYFKAMQESNVSIHRVSNIQPGKSFDAEDMLFGRAIQTVQAETVTHHMSEGEYYITRVMNVRGHTIAAGGFLPTEADMVDEANEAIDALTQKIAEEIEAKIESGAVPIEKLKKELPADLRAEPIPAFAFMATLPHFSMIIATRWIERYLEAQELVAPLLESDEKDAMLALEDEGDFEFITLAFPLATPASKAGLKDLIDQSPSFISHPTDALSWTWIEADSALSPEENQAKIDPESEFFDELAYQGILTLTDMVLTFEVHTEFNKEAALDLAKTLFADMLGEPEITQSSFDEVLAGMDESDFED